MTPLVKLYVVKEWTIAHFATGWFREVLVLFDNLTNDCCNTNRKEETMLRCDMWLPQGICNQSKWHSEKFEI